MRKILNSVPKIVFVLLIGLIVLIVALSGQSPSAFAACDSNTGVSTECDPDLTATKTNDTSGTVDIYSSFIWTITIANNGLVDATFTDGQLIFQDNLPPHGSYGSVNIGSIINITNSGNIACSITTNTLTCTAVGADVTIGGSGSFAVNVPTTAVSSDSLINPYTPNPCKSKSNGVINCKDSLNAGQFQDGICKVDPNGLIIEDNEDNNNCADTVTVEGRNINFSKIVEGGSAQPSEFTLNIGDIPQLQNVPFGEIFVPVGEFIITENGPAGYGPFPTDTEGNLCTFNENGLITVDVFIGHDFNSCSITNEKTTSLTIVKEATPQDGTDFDFTISSEPTFSLMWGSGVKGGTGSEICTSPANCQVGDGTGILGGEFRFDLDVAVDSKGDVYVADYERHRIQKFDSNGTFLRMWGSGVNGGTGAEICTVAANCKAGTAGGLGGELKGPWDINIDSSGNVYVAERTNNRVQKFDSDGNFIRMWGSGVNGGTGPEICTVAANCNSGVYGATQGGEMRDPQGVATDSSGNVYVADMGKGRIQKFDSDGNFLRLWGSGVNGGFGPEICTVAATCQSGTSGHQGGEFVSPTDVVVDGNNDVYVADFSGNRIQKFDDSGAFLRMWGSGVNGGTGPEICTVAASCLIASSSGTQGGEFNGTASVSVSSSNHVYVADYTKNRIQKFDSSGNFILMLGSGVNGGTGPEICLVAASCQDGVTGTQGGEFNYPDGVAVDNNGNLYVADTAAHRVQKFAQLDTVFTLDDANPDDGDGINQSITFNKLIPGTYDITEIVSAPWNLIDATCTGAGGSVSLTDETLSVAVGAGEDVVCTFENSRVGTLEIVKEATPEDGTDFDFTISSEPTFSLMWGKGVNGGTGSEICTSPANCQVGDGTGILGGEFRFDLDVAVDSKGDVYVADYERDRIQKFDSNGTFLRMWGSGVNGGTGPEICTVAANCQAGTAGGLGGELKGPWDINIDSSGNVYVAERTNHRIQKFDSDGNFIRMWGSGVNGGTGPEICTVAANCKSGVIGGTQGGEIRDPQGVATDSSGNVYVAELGRARIQKFDSDGNFLRLWGSAVNGGFGPEICTVAATCQSGNSGHQGGEFVSPNDVVVDSNNDVYVADFSGNRIQKFDDSGTFLRMWGSGVNGGTGPEICTVAASCRIGSPTGTQGGEFNGPASVSVSTNNNVYVADYSKNRIQKFDSSGSFILMLGSGVNGGSGPEICSVAASCQDGVTGPQGGEFNYPDGVAVDNSGNIYVADTAAHRVQKFVELNSSFTLDDANPDDGDLVNQSITFNDLIAGSYDITEIVSSGWILDNATCTGGSDSGSLTNQTLSVTLAGGEDVVCTFRNVKSATLTIIKEAQPPDGTDFAFNLRRLSTPGLQNLFENRTKVDSIDFFLDDAVPDDNDGIESSATFNLPPGSYVVTETVPPGWTLESIDCGNAPAEGIDNEINVFLQSGDNVICTFTNVADGDPSIKVNKDADPSEVWEPGGDVEFIIDTRNNGDVPVTITDIDDSFFGNLSDECDLPVQLAVDQTFTCRFTEYIGGNGGDIHFNRVTVTARDSQQNEVKDTSDEDVHILDIPSSIKVEKDAAKSEVLEPGEDLTFTITVKNTSPVDEVTIETVSDNVYGDLTAECLPTGPETLQVGETFTCDFTRYVGGQTGDIHENTVTVSGTDDDGQSVSDSDSEQVQIDNVASSIKVDLRAGPDQVYEPGDDVTFTVDIHNSSTADSVTIEQINDDVFGDVTAECLSGGAVTLNPGSTHTCAFTRYIGGQMDDVHSGQVTVLGTDDDGYGVSDSASDSVLLLDTPSSLLVTQTVSPREVVAPGGDVTFTVTILNDSVADEVTVDSLEDTVYPGIAANCAPALPATIKPGESITCSMTTYIGGQSGDVFSSRATASGEDDDGYPVGDGSEVSIHIVQAPYYTIFFPSIRGFR